MTSGHEVQRVGVTGTVYLDALKSAELDLSAACASAGSLPTMMHRGQRSRYICCYRKAL